MKKKLKILDKFLSLKRQSKSSKRIKLLHTRVLNRLSEESQVKRKFGAKSQLISLIANSYKGKAMAISGVLRLKIPECFSIIDSPETVLANLGQFAKTYKSCQPRSAQIDHSALINYDLAANGILDLIVVEANKETKLNNKHKLLKWSGVFPKDKDVRRFIRGAGIIKHLNLSKKYPRDEESVELKIFDVRNHHYYSDNPTKADKKTMVTAKFADHVNSCLSVSGKELTFEARHQLCEYIGEILDNVEQHAGMTDWTIQGYLDTSCKIPICEIAIFNFGKTIAENLGSVSRDSYTWKQIGHYILLHRAKKLFSSSWSENDLLTLIALQEKVSSKNITQNDTRGNGSVDLIEFFQKIYDENINLGEKRAKMAILSGNTHITFDGTYKLSSIGSAPRKIAFNKQNDLLFPPDKEYVRSLKNLSFPGTVISIKFPINTNILLTSEEKVDE